MLLAGPSASEVVADTTGDDWEADREALVSRELAMTEFLDPARTGAAHRPARRLGRVADADLRAEALPHVVLRGAAARRAATRDVSTESSSVTWLPAAEAVAMAEAGEMLMMPPTYLTSLEVSGYAVAGRGRRGRAGSRRRDAHARRRAARRRVDAVDPAAPRAGAARPGTHERRVASAGTFGSRGRCLLAPEPGPDDARRHQHVAPARAGGRRCRSWSTPGPIEDGHLDLVDELTGDVGLILLTHHHFDHSEVARSLAERKGCAVRALDPAFCVGADPLVDDEVLAGRGACRCASSRRPATPPTRSRSCVPAERALLSGDMVLGRGTTVVAYPDGQLGPYFDSIAKMRALVTAGEVDAIWPAHGPVLPDGGGVLDYYLAHRRQRLDQVRAALGALGVAVPDPDDEHLPRRVVEIVYADVDESLWDFAEWSVRAQLAYLAERG